MMEKLSGPCQVEDHMDMPPGFRFHPTDEELITHYLSKKVVDHKFLANAIGEVDMNQIEPWELPKVAKMGEKQWYFFYLLDKKYPTGLRTNRATAAGYWKATGKDKAIFQGQSLIGMKKTLVFYIGRAPKGEKTNWITHEYRLEGKYSKQNFPKSSKTEWVISRVFHKNSGEKKVTISGLTRTDVDGVATSLPPLIDSPATLGGRIINRPSTSEYVTCFSNPLESYPNPLLEGQSTPITDHFPFGSPFSAYDHPALSGLTGRYGIMKTETEMFTGSQETGISLEKNIEISSKFEKGKRGIEDQEAPSTSVGPVDLDCIWNY